MDQGTQQAHKKEKKGKGKSKKLAKKGKKVVEESTSVGNEKQTNWVLVILKELYLFLEVFPLHQDSFNYTLEILTDLTRFREDFVPDGKAKKKNPGGAEEKITKLAFDTLHRLIQPVLEEPDADSDAHQMVREVFKNLLPSLLMTFDQGATTPIPKYKIHTRDNTLEFLNSLISEIDGIEVSDDNNARKSNKEQLFTSVHALLQHTCAQVPEKADYRNHACQVVASLFGVLPLTVKPRFLAFLSRYSKNAKAAYRLFAVQIAMSLVELSSEGEEQACKALLEIILSRASDKVASVRARSLDSVATLLQLATANSHLKSQVYQLVTLQDNQTDKRQNFLSLLVKRTDDEKCNVRRVAIQALETIGMLSDELVLSKAELRHLVDKCGDSALSIRK